MDFNLKETKNIEILNQLLKRFNISTSENNKNEVLINLEDKNKSLTFLSEPKDALYVYDTETNKLAVTIKEYNIADDIISHIVNYIDDFYKDLGYGAITITSIIMQIDGCYHTEPNTIVFVKNEFLDKDIDSIVYLPDNRVIAVSENNNEEFIFDKDSFISPGMYIL